MVGGGLAGVVEAGLLGTSPPDKYHPILFIQTAARCQETLSYITQMFMSNKNIKYVYPLTRFCHRY